MVVNNVINFVTAFAGLGSAAVVLGVLQPILVVVVLLAQLPGAWAAVRSARIRYVTRFALVDSYRRKYILANLIARRQTAAELRSFTLRSFLLGRVARLAAYAREAELTAARQRTVTQVLASAMSGVATVGVYATLGALLACGRAAALGRGHRRAGAAVGRRIDPAADVRRQPVLRRGPVLLRLPRLLRRRGRPDPGRGHGPRPGRVLPDHRRRGDVLLPRRGHPGPARRLASRSTGAR